MAARTRFKTKYPGVYYIEGKSVAKSKPERIYYIRYRRNGRQIEEKAGRQFQDDMTPARAATVRAGRMEGKELSNAARRDEERSVKWTIDNLWEEYKSHKAASKALSVDTGRYENYIKPLMGDKEPRELVSLDVKRLSSKLRKSKAPQTVKHVLGILKRIGNYGVNEGLTAGIGFKIEMPKVDNRVTEDLNPEQLSRLLAAIESDPNRDVATMMLMALFTGMRRGEIFKLKWEDISFHRGFILIRDPKGKKDQRIPLNEDTRYILEQIHRAKSPYVFPGKNGKQRVTAAKASCRIRKKADLPKTFRPFHGLRHTYASMLASSGQVDMYTLQKLLTHKSPLMTQRYAHLRDETLKRAADLAGNIINDAMEERQKIVPNADQSKVS